MIKRILTTALAAMLPGICAAQISFTNLGNSTGGSFSSPDIFSGTDATSYSNTSWTPPTSGLIVVFVSAEKSGGSGTPTTPTMSGNSLTWTRITGPLQCINRNGLTIFAADANGSTTGQTTISFGSTTQIYCSASFFQATGIDLSGGVAAVFVQTPSNTGTGTSLEITLNAAGNSNNRPIAGFMAANFGTIVNRANWTELDDLPYSEQRALGTQYRSDTFETTASASWTNSVDCCGIAAELKWLNPGGANAARVIIINQ